MSRTSLLLSGGIGLLANAVLSGLCVRALRQGWLPLLPTGSTLTWGLFVFLVVFSLAEIPLMIFGMRQMLRGQRGRTRPLVVATNGAFVFFAAVYAAPQYLLSGALSLGLVLSALSLVRWLAAAVFLPGERAETRTDE